MLRPSSPLTSIYQAYGGRDREHFAKALLLEDGYPNKPVTPINAYTNATSSTHRPSIGHTSSSQPTAERSSSWRQQLPITPEKVFPPPGPAGEEPKKPSWEAREGWADSTFPHTFHNDKWNAYGSPTGISISRTSGKQPARTKIKNLIQEARILSEHVSETTMKQIEYFMTTAPPPLSAAEATRRLTTAKGSIAPPSPFEEPPTPGTEDEFRQSVGEVPPLIGEEMGLQKDDPRKFAPGRRDLPAVSSWEENVPGVQRRRRVLEKEPSAEDTHLARLARNELHLAVKTPEENSRPKPQIRVLQKEVMTCGGGFRKKRPMPLPKWKEHSRLLEDAQDVGGVPP